MVNNNFGVYLVRKARHRVQDQDLPICQFCDKVPLQLPQANV